MLLVTFVLAILLCGAYAIAMPAQAHADDHVGRIRIVENEEGSYWSSSSELLKRVKSMGKESGYSTVIVDLYEDFTTSEMIEVPKGKTFTFNLHGHMINRNLAGTKSSDAWWGTGSGEVFCVEGKLIVNGGADEEANIEHKGSTADEGRWWHYDGSGSTVIKGGLITGGACDDYYGAGGIALQGSDAAAELNNVTIAGNVADQWASSYGHGGGIGVHGNNSQLTLNNTKVIYNHAEGYGGGIYVREDGTKVSIKNSSEVSNNMGILSGGGIYFDDNNVSLTLDASKVSGNKTHDDGGGIYTTGNGSVLLQNGAKVESNYAQDKGGGIYYNGSNGTLTVDNASYVSSNTAVGNGGGIYHNGSNGVVNVSGGSYISDNKASNGGGIYDYYNDTTFNINGSKIENNSANSNGGGIFLQDAATLNVANSAAISNNKAANGGGIYVNDNDTYIYVNSNSEVSGNKATSNGGGIYHNDSVGVVSFNNAKLANNTATGNGGGIYNDYENTAYYFDNGASVEGNSASNGGGMYSYDYAYVYVKENSSFNNNTANNGGAIYATEDGLYLTFAKNGSIHDNVAKINGGGIYSDYTLRIEAPGYQVKVWYTDYKNIYSNKAEKGAGIWFAKDAYLDNVVIKNNTAEVIGGGVYCNNTTDEDFCFANSVVVQDNTIGGSEAVKSNVVVKGKQLLHGYDEADDDARPAASSVIYVTVEDYASGSRQLSDTEFSEDLTKETRVIDYHTYGCCKGIYADDENYCHAEYVADDDRLYYKLNDNAKSLDQKLAIEFGNGKTATINTYKWAFIKLNIADFAKNGYAPDYFVADWKNMSGSDFCTFTPFKDGNNYYISFHTPSSADNCKITAHYPHYAVKVHKADGTTVTDQSDVEAGSEVTLDGSNYTSDGMKPTYWTIKDSSGTSQILWPKDGDKVTFAMLGSDVVATPYYPNMLSGVELSLSESSIWDDLVPDSTDTTTAAVAGLTVTAESGTSYTLTADDLKDVSVESRSVAKVVDYLKDATYTVRIPSSAFAKYNIAMPTDAGALKASGSVSAQYIDTREYDTGQMKYPDFKAEVIVKDNESYVEFTVIAAYMQPGEDTYRITTKSVDVNEESKTLSTSSSYCKQGKEATVRLIEKTGWKFTGWKNKPDGASEDPETHDLTFTPTGNVELIATYAPLVSAVDISVDSLEADGTFPAQVKTANARDNAGAMLAAGTSSIVWTTSDGADVEKDAKPQESVTYNAALTLGLSASSVASSYHWAFADTVNVTLNGTPVDASKVKTAGAQQLVVSYSQTAAAGSDDRVFTVSFDAGAEGVDAPATQNVKKGSTATEPDALVTESKKVVGWYTDAQLLNLYDFSTPVESDLTLHAKWAARTYTVSFDSHGGTEVKDQTVAYGNTATKPTDPKRDGYVFEGWKTSKGIYDFNTAVTGDITLKASWEEESDDWCKVTFDSAGGSEVKTQWVADGSKVKKPDDPIRDGYVFKGWALNGELFDFANPVTRSITLVAVWEKQGADLIDISAAKVTLKKARFAYNGKVKKATVASVVLDGKTLAAGDDYIVSIVGGKKVGTYKVTVIGTGSYAGSAFAAYKVVPAKVKGLKAKAAGKGKISLTWTKAKAQRSGVQVRYATAKSMKGAVKVKAKGAAAKAKTVKKLKSGKKYYVQVRAYKKAKDGKTYYSSWSATKVVKVR